MNDLKRIEKILSKHLYESTDYLFAIHHCKVGCIYLISGKNVATCKPFRILVKCLGICMITGVIQFIDLSNDKIFELFYNELNIEHIFLIKTLEKDF